MSKSYKEITTRINKNAGAIAKAAPRNSASYSEQNGTLTAQ